MFNRNFVDNKIHKVGIYIRLSQEDSDKKFESDSESVINQRNILKTYIENNNYILEEEYIDDGYSGTNFDRPGFKRMIQDIRNKKINMVIVKDLSRLGRDHVMTGYFIETFFPENRIRFISIMENYDSFKNQPSNDSSTFIVACNDYYSKQNSYKVRDVLRSKKMAGDFVGSRPSYGYMRDPNNKGHLIPDPETADNVRNIFRWFSSGMSMNDIADKLNNAGVLTPSAYKNLPGKLMKWNAKSVKTILINRIYTGDMVQNKETKISYKSKKKVYVPESNWIVVENTHEPLVDKSTFNEINNKGKYTIPKIKSNREKRLLENLFVCKECGNGLTINYRGKLDYWTINCNKFTRDTKEKQCVSHFMSYNPLESAILKKVKHTLKTFIDNLDIEYLANEVNKRMNDYKDKDAENLQKLKKSLEEKKQLLVNLYNDKYKKLLTDTVFGIVQNDYENDIKGLQEKIKGQEKKVSNIISYDDKIVEIINNIKQLLDLKKPTRELLLSVIDKIVIDKDRNVEIYYKFKTTETIK